MRLSPSAFARADALRDGDTREPSCRFCSAPLVHTFVDLGTSPLCQRHVTPEMLDHAEPVYPLHVYVCDKCWLVQLPEHVSPREIFSDYAYFSSFSETLLKHSEDYVEQMIARFGIGATSKVVELASNDGYLLQFFVKRGVSVLGVEPAETVANAAIKKGIPTVIRFFGRQTAAELARDGTASLIIGNNVLAHVPDINDFIVGMRMLLAPDGVITMEFPQLLQLIARRYWDTIYHEHFSYLSFTTVDRIFAHHGLVVFGVDEIPTHGGSIRIYARHADDRSKPVHARVADMKVREKAAGHFELSYYSNFGDCVKESKRALLEFLTTAKRAGKSIVGYGAPGKGNTLLNYCGIRGNFLDYTVDRNPKKQGNYLPGTRIPISSPDRIRETRPDYLLLLPWNLKVEIMKQMREIRAWGGKFVVPIPDVQVYE